MRIRGDLRFWGRIAGQACIVNVPLAWALASGALGAVAAFTMSALLAVATLAIWDRTRSGEPSEAAATVVPSRAGLRASQEAALAA